MMFLQVIILLAGFLFLVKGADWFVEGAASIAKKLGIPQLIIGLTIVAMGTSMPEAAVSIKCSRKQYPEYSDHPWNYSSNYECSDSEIHASL